MEPNPPLVLPNRPVEGVVDCAAPNRPPVDGWVVVGVPNNDG